MLSTTSLLNDLRNSNGSANWQELLGRIIEEFGCSTGTLHAFDPEARVLLLLAHQGIPPFLLPKMTEIPVGKGMAGIAAERREPVEMCNLQTDDSGVARPAAKETKVEGSIAVPMLVESELCGVLGIAKPVPYEFTEEEKTSLLQIGEEIGRILKSTGKIS